MQTTMVRGTQLVEEIQCLLGEILFMSIVRLLKVSDYYRTTSLFHGRYARSFIPS